MKSSPLRIIATGGTFDKRYDPVRGSLSFDQTCLPALIAESRIQPAPEIDVAMLVDSLDMTPAHRLALVDCCR